MISEIEPRKPQLNKTPRKWSQIEVGTILESEASQLTSKVSKLKPNVTRATSMFHNLQLEQQLNGKGLIRCQ